ncbi:MAG: rare lipoprotein [Solirubrobacteraceae bacterium]|nr:rare lipoprotein [Solirubrobacteraceae bacterium]
MIPVVIAPSTGGTGYGDAGTRSLVARPSALLGRVVSLRGTMPHAAHRQVILQRLDARRGWRAVARGRVRTSEHFLVSWRTDRSGTVRLRAVLAPRAAHARRRGRDRAAAASTGHRAPAAAAPVVDVTVYRPAMASFYGPGFFGRQTACGVTLMPETTGVAHRRLPCGTLVQIMYRGREIIVPVIDRGPFSNRYSWDLTQATADALGFQGGGGIGYMRAPAALAPAPA